MNHKIFKRFNIIHNKISWSLSKKLISKESIPANYSNKYNIIFFHVPKTGGMSMTNICDEYYGHARAIEVRAFFKEKWSQYFKFGFVRNPYERIASAFFYIKNMPRKHEFYAGLNITQKKKFNKIEFKEFCLNIEHYIKDDKHFKAQAYWLCDKNDEVLVDFVGKLETINEDWKFICDKIDIPFIRLKKLNVTKGKANQSYINFYDEEMKEKIYHHYKRDFDIFDFKK